jgi:hypothetical protein
MQASQPNAAFSVIGDDELERMCVMFAQEQQRRFRGLALPPPPTSTLVSMSSQVSLQDLGRVAGQSSGAIIGTNVCPDTMNFNAVIPSTVLFPDTASVSTCDEVGGKRKLAYDIPDIHSINKVFDIYYDPTRNRSVELDAKCRKVLACDFNLTIKHISQIVDVQKREEKFFEHLKIIRAYKDGISLNDIETQFPHMTEYKTRYEGWSVRDRQLSNLMRIVNPEAERELNDTVAKLVDKETANLSNEELNDFKADQWRKRRAGGMAACSIECAKTD